MLVSMRVLAGATVTIRSSVVGIVALAKARDMFALISAV